MLDLTQKQFVKHAVLHPFEGFEDLRWKNAGSLKYSFVIIMLLFVALAARDSLYGFQFAGSGDKMFSVMPYITKSVLLFGAWSVSNWSVCTLLDGEGTLRKIAIYSSYALIPYIAQLYINTALSHILIRDEIVFMQAVFTIGTAWSVLLMFSAVKAVHQYSVAKTVGAIVLTIAAMLVIMLLLVLLLSLVQQVYVFIYSVYTEAVYRLKV